MNPFRPAQQAVGTSLLIAVLAGSGAAPALAKVYRSFADVAEKAIPGVVNIRTTSYKPDDTPVVDLYEFFLRGGVPGTSSNHAVGSGLIFDGKGHILTNYHVVNEASRIEVLFAERQHKARAKVIGMDPKSDLALLKAELPPGSKPVPLGDSNKLRVGDVVLAIGNPFGYSHTVTSGIISAKGRVLGSGPYDNFLQTDASIHPGNSGGPLLNVKGRVVGINTAVSEEGSGIGFAIPINLAKRVSRDLVEHGRVKRPWLGVIGENILSSDELETGGRISGIYGVVIANLIVGSPGYEAGLRVGDLIMAADGTKISGLAQLQRLLYQKNPKDRIRLKIYRREKGFLHQNVSLKALPAAKDLPAEGDVI